MSSPPQRSELSFVPGDRHYHDDEVEVLTACRLSDRLLITTRSSPYPHRDDGAAVRKVFHKRRSVTIEPFNNLFKNVFEGHGQVPVKGLARVLLTRFC